MQGDSGSLPFGMGWKRDNLDPRDFRFAASPSVVKAVSPTGDLRDGFTSAYDQLDEGSCTANGGAAYIDYMRFQMGLPPIYGSRNFLYYNERTIEGTVSSDAGAQIRSVMQALDNWGICPEAQWEYSPNTLYQKPSPQVYVAATKDTAISYYSVPQASDQILGALASGYPIIFGFMIYQDYQNLDHVKGVVPLPDPRMQPLGGHCNVLCGWDTTRARHNDILLLSRNSWGTKWGIGGYCWIPMSYLLNPQLAADFWVMSSEGPEPAVVPTPPVVPVPVVADSYDVGPGVRAWLAELGLIPKSHEMYPDTGRHLTGWTSFVFASDNKFYAWISDEQRLVPM